MGSQTKSLTLTVECQPGHSQSMLPDSKVSGAGPASPNNLYSPSYLFTTFFTSYHVQHPRQVSFLWLNCHFSSWSSFLLQDGIYLWFPVVTSLSFPSMFWPSVPTSSHCLLWLSVAYRPTLELASSKATYRYLHLSLSSCHSLASSQKCLTYFLQSSCR